LALERTGPYIPPITLPGIGDVLVTSPARALLESSGLSGFTFLPVEKVLIVQLHWEQWNLKATQPAQYPETGEPEDYILGQPHSANAAATMGEVWEVAVPPTVRIIRPEGIVESHDELKIDLSTWRGNDLFRSSEYGAMLFTKRARDWFCEQFGQYVRFESFPTA